MARGWRVGATAAGSNGPSADKAALRKSVELFANPSLSNRNKIMILQAFIILIFLSFLIFFGTLRRLIFARERDTTK